MAAMPSLLILLLLCSGAFGEECPPETRSDAVLDVGLCEHKLGLADYADGRTEEAETHYLRALAAWERSGDQYAAQRVATLIGLGRLYQSKHRSQEAARMLNRALELARPLEAAEPKLTAIALSRLGGVYSMSGNVEQARSLLVEAIAKLHALQPADLPELAYAYNSLGMTELRAGAYASGEANLRQAVSVATGCLGESNPQTAMYETNLGLALYLQGEHSRALPLLRRAEFLLESRPDENSFQLGTALAELSAVEISQGKFTLAENDASRALGVFNKHFAAGSAEVARAQVNLAAIYLVEHKTAEAAEILPDAVATERRVLRDGRALANGVRWLAQLRAQQHDWSHAASLYREAIGMYEAEPGQMPSEIGAVRREYAGVIKQERGKSPAVSPAT